MIGGTLGSIGLARRCMLVIAGVLLAGCSVASTPAGQRLASASPGVASASPGVASASPSVASATAPSTAVPTTPAASAANDASGIEGIAEASPQCPIAQPGVACPPEPVSQTIAVQTADGRELTRFTSASDGTFRVALPPGSYTLVGAAGSGTLPFLKPTPVVVPPGAFVHVVLMFDTGIR